MPTLPTLPTYETNSQLDPLSLGDIRDFAAIHFDLVSKVLRPAGLRGRGKRRGVVPLYFHSFVGMVVSKEVGFVIRLYPPYETTPHLNPLSHGDTWDFAAIHFDLMSKVLRPAGLRG